MQEELSSIVLYVAILSALISIPCAPARADEWDHLSPDEHCHTLFNVLATEAASGGYNLNDGSWDPAMRSELAYHRTPEDLAEILAIPESIHENCFVSGITYYDPKFITYALPGAFRKKPSSGSSKAFPGSVLEGLKRTASTNIFNVPGTISYIEGCKDQTIDTEVQRQKCESPQNYDCDRYERAKTTQASCEASIIEAASRPEPLPDHANHGRSRTNIKTTKAFPSGARCASMREGQDGHWSVINSCSFRIFGNFCYNDGSILSCESGGGGFGPISPKGYATVTPPQRSDHAVKWTLKTCNYDAWIAGSCHY